MRQNFGDLRPLDDPAGQHRHRSDRRADRGGGPERHEHPADLLDAIQGRTRTDQLAQQERPDDDLRHVAGLLAEQASERQSLVVEEQLCVDDEFAEENAGPPAEAPQVERAIPSPAGGQMADTEAVYRSVWPSFAAP